MPSILDLFRCWAGKVQRSSRGLVVCGGSVTCLGYLCETYGESFTLLFSPIQFQIVGLTLFIHFILEINFHVGPFVPDGINAKIAARYLYALMTPVGLRFMTPTVVYAELLACPIALLGSYFGNRHVVLSSIVLICSLHIGIAFTVRNTVLLSSVACVAWCAFLPPGPTAHTSANEKKKKEKNKRVLINGGVSNKLSACIIIPMIIGNIWFETMSGECNQSMKHIWSTVLHNRWNVFIGAEEYVTWEIAPGRLADGSVVDIWGRKDDVDWHMPGTGAPCTSTARPGRWRSFPYLAELDGEEGEALWSYLCRQWDEENGVDTLEEGDEDSGYNGNAHRKLLRYNFFMLQADVLPNMGFSSTRKRLIHSHDCTKVNFAVAAKAEVKETQTISVPTANERVEL